MVEALAIDWPAAALGPDSGTSKATRWRSVSVGSTLALGWSGGGGVGGGLPPGTALHAASRATVAIATSFRRSSL